MPCALSENRYHKKVTYTKIFFFNIILLIFCYSCSSPLRHKSEIVRRADSLSVLWRQFYSQCNLSSDSVLFRSVQFKKKIFYQILNLLEKDTLSPDDIRIMENFQSACACFENNYFLIKKNRLYAHAKYQNILHLKKDTESDILFPQAAERFLYHEIIQTRTYSSIHSTLLKEYEKCKGLTEEYFRSVLKTFYRYHNGMYSYFSDEPPFSCP